MQEARLPSTAAGHGANPTGALSSHVFEDARLPRAHACCECGKMIGAGQLLVRCGVCGVAAHRQDRCMRAAMSLVCPGPGGVEATPSTLSADSLAAAMHEEVQPVVA
jgi:hypothetical protein